MAVALVTTGLVMPIMNENIVYADTEFTDGSKALKEEDSESSVFSDDTEADSDVDEKNNFSSETDQDTVPVAGVNDGCELNQSYNIVNLRQREFGRDIYYYYSADIPNDGRIRIILEDCNEKIMDNRYFYYRGSFDKEQRLYRWWDIGTDTYDSGWITVHAGKISGELINGEYNNDVNKEAKIIIKYESQDEYQGEKELNDTYDTANIIQPNTIYEGGCINRVWGPIDIDMYKFCMEQSGLAVIDMKNLLGGDSATEFEVYEEDEHENVYLLTKATNRKRLRLPAGVYYIKESTTMQYSLKLDINYESPEEYEQENNNVRSLANEKQINTWYTGNLNTGKDIDFYKFELKKSGNANVELKVPRQSSSNAVVATLYDKDMNELDKISNNENPYATTEQKKYPAGIYYVTVKSPYSGGFEPDYSICFSQEKYKYVKQITLPENLKINTGERYTLNPQILPSDAENPKLIWSSSDNNVVTVNSNGVVTGKGDGTAVITAKAADGSGIECSTSQMELTYTVFEDYLKKHKNVEAETDNIEETENAEENAKENTESYLQIDIQEIERNPEQYAGEKIHLEAKFTVLLGNLEIWANNGYVDVEYNGTAYDVNGNEIGSVVAGDEGYVEGSVEIYDNELGNKDFRINADRVVITSDVGNDTYSQSENEKTNNTEDSSATTPEYTIYGYYMAQNGDEIYLNDSSEVSDNGTDFVAEMSVLSGSQYQWSGYIVDISTNPIQVLSKSEKAVALITPAEDGIFVEFCNSSNSQKVWYNKETENEVIDQNADSFIGAMGQYISTSGGTENYVNMEIYDSGNDSINITFKSMTHGGVVSAQGKIIGSDTVEADWNNVHFTLEWTDAGNVLVTREGSTGYSDFDKFTEYETFINNSYYQEG